MEERGTRKHQAVPESEVAQLAASRQLQSWRHGRTSVSLMAWKLESCLPKHPHEGFWPQKVQLIESCSNRPRVVRQPSLLQRRRSTRHQSRSDDY